MHNKNIFAKPIIKWAGGKTQLLPEFAKYYPKNLGTDLRKYIDPFFGGGAVFFDLYNANLIDSAKIIDANPELILLYKTIQKEPKKIIEILFEFQEKYQALDNDEQKAFFYSTREIFNANNKQTYFKFNPLRAAQFIFLNHTCFNGLFRVNLKGHFNVPHGNYKNPRILNIDKILSASQALQIAEIFHADFKMVSKIATNDCFVYYDPPYKPLNKTSHFTAYSGPFNDAHQIELANLFKDLSKKGVTQMLSNSDPFSANGDDFFEKIYSNFNLNRIKASRRINSNKSKRGEIFELLVTNYI